MNVAPQQEKDMPRIGLLPSGMVICCALLLSSCAQQQSADLNKPAMVTSDIVTKRSTVLAVNRPERMVVLRGEDGDTLGLVLDERVRNFDQIEVGDVVTAQYHEATAIFVRPSTGQPAADGADTLRTARPGDKPGAVATRTDEITASVESIAYSSRLVTLRGPRGGTRTFKVGPQVTNFDSVRKGDEVVVRHTEAVAVAVTK
jgi:hypothetical protein